MKKIFFTIMMLLVSFCCIEGVSALTVEEYDLYSASNTKFSLPSIVTSSGTSIGVDESLSNYNLYYQWINVSDSDWNTMNSINDSIKELNDSFEKYSEGVEDKTSEEYIAKSEEYVNTYNTKKSEYTAIISKFDDSKWIDITDGKPISYSGDGINLLWVKLAEADGTTTYGYKYYEASSSTSKTNTEKKNVVKSKVSTVSSDDSDTYNIETSGNYYSDSVYSDNPDTGLSDIMLYLIPILLVGGSVIVLRRA